MILHDQDQAWFDLDGAARAMARGRRAAIAALRDVPADLVRLAPGDGPGRPRKLFHCSAHPALRAAVIQQETAPEPAAAPGAGTGPAPDDLALARLRARAVMEYMERRALCASEALAAEQTCDDWRIKPRSQQVEIVERIGRIQRKTVKTVTLGGFRPSILREWHSLYKDNREVLALVPGRKRHAGRRAAEIPTELLDLVHGLAISTARADVAKAVARARENWPGDFPRLSLGTWRRRIAGRDPDSSSATLARRGIAEFRQRHSPDICRDYADMPYNALWQIDDVTEDFYGHSLEADRLVRPYAYAIIRVPTRQWVAAVATETPIVQEQVRVLVGLALADKAGGIPDVIQFERGTVALDDYLDDLLRALGCQPKRTSMDGGAVYAGAIQDRGRGHWAGKAVIEANFRKHHDLIWDARAGTGPDERATAHGNLENLKAEALRRAKAGEFLILPTPAQWRARIFGAMRDHNQTPHGGLPEIVDPASGQIRHMTPDEAAVHKRRDQVRVLDQTLLPLFYQRGLLVPVTRNGILLNDVRYGAFDPDLQARAGTKVTAYALRELPGTAYVVELGRCVEATQSLAAGADTADAIERKRAIERTARNEYEALIARVAGGQTPAIVQQTRVFSDPVPDRALTICRPDLLATRASALRAGAERMRADRTEFERRFEPGSAVVPDGGKRRPGLLAREAEAAADLAALGAV
jgi:hypothetical protein